MNCPICGSPLLVADQCAYCESCRRTFQLRNQVVEVPAGRIAATVIAGAVSSVLTSLMTKSWPLKTDPPEVKMDKISRLVAGGVASAFIGILFGLASP